MRGARWLRGALLVPFILLLPLAPSYAAPFDPAGLEPVPGSQRAYPGGWFDGNDYPYEGFLDIWNFLMFGEDDKLVVQITFDEPFEPSQVGGEHWISVMLDVDGAVGTGALFPEDAGSQASLGYDYLLDFINSSGDWTVEIVRTLSASTDDWTLVDTVPASLSSDPYSLGKPMLTAELPLSLVNDAAYIRFSAFSYDSRDTGGDGWDFVPYWPLAAHSRSFTTETLFPDVGYAGLYEKQIEDLATRGIISGYSDGTFRPDDRVKRQQFAKLIVLTLGLPTSEANVCQFRDVDVSGPAGLYPDNYVAVCASAGITVGTGNGLFSPWNDIPRAQVITMITRAAKLPEPPADYVPPFGNFSSTHYPFARKAAYWGLLNGAMDAVWPNYDFWKPAGRGETAAFLYNLSHRLH